MDRLNHYFEKFLTENKDELEFCLTQSQVELWIRSKFAYWMNKNQNSKFCLIETNRIDLIIEIENIVYLLEFGHLINLLKHDAENRKSKIKNDSTKMHNKYKSIVKKIPHIFRDKAIKFYTVSLFTDFKLEETQPKKKYNVAYVKDGFINAGVFIKYGTAFSYKNMNKYNETYRSYFSDFNETIIEKGKLSFFWHFENVPLET